MKGRDLVEKKSQKKLKDYLGLVKHLYRTKIIKGETVHS